MESRILVFDVDGVLVRPRGFANLLRQSYGFSPDQTRPFFTGPFRDCLLGDLDLHDVLPPFLRSWDWPGSVGDFIDLWLEADDQPEADLIHYITGLSAAGAKCYVATNQERNRARYIEKEMGFGDAFEGLFFSCDIGTTKPDTQFFTHIGDSLGIAPSNITFWDDDVRNVEAARKVGWSAEVYTGFDDFRELVSRDA